MKLGAREIVQAYRRYAVNKGRLEEASRSALAVDEKGDGSHKDSPDDGDYIGLHKSVLVHPGFVIATGDSGMKPRLVPHPERI